MELIEILKYTAQVAQGCSGRDLSEDSMVIGTPAIVDTPDAVLRKNTIETKGAGDAFMGCMLHQILINGY